MDIGFKLISLRNSPFARNKELPLGAALNIRFIETQEVAEVLYSYVSVRCERHQ